MVKILFPALLSNGPFLRPERRTRLRENCPEVCGFLRGHPAMSAPANFLQYLSRPELLFPPCVMRPTPIRVPRQPWVHRLRIKGYDPADISVKVDGEKVIIHAKHEDIDGENIDRYETTRSVKIPENVNKEKLGSFLIEGGFLVITGPFEDNVKKASDSSNKSETAEKEATIEIQREPKPDETFPFTENAVKSEANHREADNNVNCIEQEVSLIEQKDPMSNNDFDVNKNGANGEEIIVGTLIPNEKKEAVKEKADISEVIVDKADSVSLTALTSDGRGAGGELITVGTLIPNEKKEAIDEVADKPKFIVEEPQATDSLDDQDDTCNSLVTEDSFVIMSAQVSPVTSLDNNPHIPELAEKLESEIADENPSLLSKIGDLTDDCTTETIEINGQKFHQIMMKLDDYKPENVSIRTRDSVLLVDATKEQNNAGIVTTQRIHRQFVVPVGGDIKRTVAKMSDDGVIKLLVPLNERHGVNKSKQD